MDFKAHRQPLVKTAPVRRRAWGRKGGALRVLALLAALMLIVPVAAVAATTTGYNQTPPPPKTETTTTTYKQTPPPPKTETTPAKEVAPKEEKEAVTKTTKSSKPAREVGPSSSVTSTRARAGTLPFTGLDLRWLLFGGVLLLSGGLSIVLTQRARHGTGR